MHRPSLTVFLEKGSVPEGKAVLTLPDYTPAQELSSSPSFSSLSSLLTESKVKGLMLTEWESCLKLCIPYVISSLEKSRIYAS